MIAPIFARRPEKGAETLIWLAASPEAGRFNGEYFYDKKVAEISGRARDPELSEQLWNLSERLCQPQVSVPAQAS